MVSMMVIGFHRSLWLHGKFEDGKTYSVHNTEIRTRYSEYGTKYSR